MSQTMRPRRLAPPRRVSNQEGRVAKLGTPPETPEWNPENFVPGTFSIGELLREAAFRHANDPLADYVPTSVENHDQLAFHQSPKKYRGIGGGNRGGKSQCHAADLAWQLRGNHPYINCPKPSLIWLISNNYKTLEKGVLPHLMKFLPPWTIHSVGAKLPKTNIPTWIKVHCCDPQTGEYYGISHLQLESAQGGAEAMKRLMAQAVDRVAIDEEIPSGLQRELEARVVESDGQITWSATLVHGEPWFTTMQRLGLAGHAQYFHTYLFTENNPHINQTAVADWASTMSEDERDVRLHGKSKRLTYLIYGMWDGNKHLVDQFTMPDGAVVIASLDPGVKVFAGIWVAVCPSGHDYIIDIMYERNTNTKEAATRIREIERWGKGPGGSWIAIPHMTLDPVTRIFDRAQTRRTETGEAGVGELLIDKYGIIVEPSYHGTKEMGYEYAKRWLGLHTDGQPRLRVLRNLQHSQDFVNEIINYRRVPDWGISDKAAPKEIAVARDDHLMDCFKNLAVYVDNYRQEILDAKPDPDPRWDELMKQHRRVMGEREARAVLSERLGITGDRKINIPDLLDIAD